MRDKQPKRKFLVRLTKIISYTALVWARYMQEAVSVANEYFDHLVENGKLFGSCGEIECLTDLSKNQYCAKDPAFDIDTGDWTQEQLKEAEK